MTGRKEFVPDSLLEGAGFEPSVPRESPRALKQEYFFHYPREVAKIKGCGQATQATLPFRT
jgi:hypothetical protein